MPLRFTTTGYFSEDSRTRPKPVPVEVPCSNYGHRYTVSLQFLSTHRLSVSFDLLRQSVRQVRELFKSKGEAELYHQFTVMQGIGVGKAAEKQVTAWFRTNGTVDMISFDLAQAGQLSVQYNVLASAIAKDCRGFA